MIYQVYHNPLGVNVEISSFFSHQKEGVSEFNLMFSTKDCASDTNGKIKALIHTYKEIVGKRLLGDNIVTVFARWFLSDASNQAHEINKNEFDCSTSIIEQPPVDGSKIALWLYCQSSVSTTKQGDNLYSVRHGQYNHLWLGDRVTKAKGAEGTTYSFLCDYARILERFHCSLLENCLRTWYFVRDIDVNYPGVVKGRNDVFSKEGLTIDSHFIASTGIEGATADSNEVLSFNAYAVEGIKKEQVGYLKGKSHLNPTMDYGVAFERGTMVDYGDRRHVFISGTASIDNTGHIVYPGDILKQTERILENIGVLLNEAQTAWSDVTHIIVYLRDFSDYNTVDLLLENRHPKIPKIIVQAPVCRTGWLVEMECMAIKSIECRDFAPL